MHGVKKDVLIEEIREAADWRGHVSIRVERQLGMALCTTWERKRIERDLIFSFLHTQQTLPIAATCQDRALRQNRAKVAVVLHHCPCHQLLCVCVRVLACIWVRYVGKWER